MRVRKSKSSSSGTAAKTPSRGNFTGKGKEKRDVISTTHPSLRRSGRGRKYVVTIPPGVTGTGEQSS